ncbi:TetR/AcrR family transcriptional regulator [Pectobacteriaceae bacterium CE90]|nr:TetR/AcrR family transcriptional regulator [Prodigiosinella sp. LS101]WJV53905.1 TetR/AcrR family transcriptional regulator [Prodigiosinella sp. LS101]WJV58267.1 TetR/AcrR family transcriptional regulator [Pectobacteriaceae bacterium C111]WJY15120.1 TetR/AcrR family transcriptional regulator [Pectobacteriaceae bacterium CE90]
MSNPQDDEVREKTKERRKQVLDAAADCFRKEGFHGCSIAKISKAAGMSPGHIYYHFANKEAIVEALVAQQEHTLLELVNDIAAAPPDEALVDSLTRQTERMIEHHTSPDFVGLWLEIVAEAARNPSVAKLLQLSHKNIVAQFDEQLIKRSNTSNAEEFRKLSGKMDIIALIFSGLSQHVVTRANENKIDYKRLSETINSVIKHLFKT